MKRILAGGILAVWCLAWLPAGAAAQAQSDFMECAACQLLLRLVEGSAGDGGRELTVDASKQCAILPQADREACARFYATYGPKFIKTVMDRRTKGESLEQICRTMGYCRQQ